MLTEKQVLEHWMKENPKATKKEIQERKRLIKQHMKTIESHLTF